MECAFSAGKPQLFVDADVETDSSHDGEALGMVFGMGLLNQMMFLLGASMREALHGCVSFHQSLTPKNARRLSSCCEQPLDSGGVSPSFCIRWTTLLSQTLRIKPPSRFSTAPIPTLSSGSDLRSRVH